MNCIKVGLAGKRILSKRECLLEVLFPLKDSIREPIFREDLFLYNCPYREIGEKYKKAVLGVNSAPPRWKTCVSNVGFNSFSDSSFRVVASSMYIQGGFTIIIQGVPGCLAQGFVELDLGCSTILLGQ